MQTVHKTVRVVNETYDAETETRPRLLSDETETRPRRWSIETEMRPRYWSDGIETRPRCSEKRLETETFETETTTLKTLSSGPRWSASDMYGLLITVGGDFSQTVSETCNMLNS